MDVNEELNFCENSKNKIFFCGGVSVRLGGVGGLRGEGSG